MTSLEIKKILESAGFVHKGGSNHDKFEHPDGRVTVIFRHRGDIPTGTLKAISREAGIPLVQHS